MKKFLSIAIALLALPTHAQNLTINDFEKIGFIKENQPLFQMVGAIDGWKGKFKGNQIEVYLYESKSKIPANQLRTIIEKYSGTFCITKNSAILEYSNGDFCALVTSRLR